MKRRDFLKLTNVLCAGSSLGLMPQLSFAQTDNYQGPFILTIEANNGWDPTSFCDPKGRDNGKTEREKPNDDQKAAGLPGSILPINHYNKADISQVGNIRFAPAPDTLPDVFPDNTLAKDLFSSRQFFTNHHERLTVINGVNTKTNAHLAGKRLAWTGVQTEGYPNIGALMASQKAPNYMMPFVSFGGTDATSGLLVPTKINNNAIKDVAYNDFINTNNPKDRFFESALSEKISAARNARQERQLADQNLLNVRRGMQNFFDVSKGKNIDKLQDFVGLLSAKEPASLTKVDDFNNRTGAFNLYNDGRTALIAFESGSAVSAHIRSASFDTHNNHDALHYPRLMDYMHSVDAIIAEAKKRGLADRLIIMMASDFGRTNKYNNDGGKDHWAHTSTMLWASEQYFPGNRVIGGTDVNQRSLKVNPSTLEIMEDQKDDAGRFIEPIHIQQALRGLLDIDNSAVAIDRFSLNAIDMPFFV